MSQAEDAPQAKRSELLHGGFTAVPNLVLLREDLSGNAKTLYALILDIVQFQKRQPTVDDLARLLGGGERIVRKCTAELVDANLVKVHRRGLGMPNAYILLEPPPLILQNDDSGNDETQDPSVSSKDFKIQDRAPTSGARARDMIWETLVEVFGSAPAGTERGRWNVACKSLKESGATPSLIRSAASTYRTHPTYSQCVMTPTALACNWTILTATPKTATELQLEQSYRKMREAEARYERT